MVSPRKSPSSQNTLGKHPSLFCVSVCVLVTPIYLHIHSCLETKGVTQLHTGGDDDGRRADGL